MSRIKTIRTNAAALVLIFSSGIAMAESRLIDIYANLNGPSANTFFTVSSMEPPPSGKYILEDITINGSRDFTHVAGDGAGGAFIELPDGRIFLISSEGEAAGIAPDLETAIRISVGVNSIYDTLRFIKGDLASDKAAWLNWSLEWGVSPGPQNDAILRSIALDPLDAPFETLHANVTANADVIVSHPNGDFVSFAR